MKQFCIVIPVYKKDLNCVEEVSIQRLNKIVGKKNYDVYLVCPDSLDTTEYDKYFSKLKIERFADKYFQSTATYSQLCVSYDFYDRFSNYQYMLIYQLDCYIFEDKIRDWCNKGYDYIGGPILSTDCGWDTVKKSQKKYQPYVGNGGLSLRKIEVFKEICDPNGELRKTYNITDEKLETIKWEDKYFCNDLYPFYDLNVPDWREALYFGMDMSIDVIYNYFKFKDLPMAVHSWDKNIRWWRTRLDEIKDRPEVWDFCEEKHKEFFKLYYDENDSTLRK